jgi:hypothetical protein
LLLLVGHLSGAPARAGEPLDLDALIEQECGPEGVRPNQGCRVRLPRGVFEIDKTLSIGKCTLWTARNGLILEGQGSAPHATQPIFATGATVLEWKGGSEPMIEICGSSSVSIRDLVLAAKGASVGIRVLANNAAASISHFTELRDLVIHEPVTGVYVGGGGYDDQSDFVRLERVSIVNAVIGYDQDSQQSAAGRLETVEVVASRVGYRVRGGPLHCDGCYVGTAPSALSGFMGFHLTRSARQDTRNLAHHQVLIQNSHMELRTGRFIVDDAATPYPLTLIGNSYSLQCPFPSCIMRVIDSNSTGPVNIVGDVLQGLDAGSRAQYCLAGPVNQMGLVKKPEVQDVLWICN